MAKVDISLNVIKPKDVFLSEIKSQKLIIPCLPPQFKRLAARNKVKRTLKNVNNQ